MDEIKMSKSGYSYKLLPVKCFKCGKTEDMVVKGWTFYAADGKIICNECNNK